MVILTFLSELPEDKAAGKVLRAVDWLLRYRILDTPVAGECVRVAGNPIQAFLLLWRTTQVLPLPPSHGRCGLGATDS